MKKALFLFAILLAAASAAWGGDFVVIANSSLAGMDVSASDLKQIYLGVRSSLHGKPVEPVVAQSGPAHQRFVSDCLGKTEPGLRNYYRNLVFTGKGSMPRSFATTAEMVSYIAKTMGAIGYVADDVEVKGISRLTLK